MAACWAATVALGWTLSMVARTLSPFHVVALVDVEVGDAAKGRSADVDVGLGLDLAGSADEGDEILAGDLGGGDLGDAGAAMEDGADGDAGEHKDDKDEQSYFFCIHSSSRSGSELPSV